MIKGVDCFMQTLADFLDSYASCANIQFDRKAWHIEAGIPNESGWYFIRTNTPLNVLQQQELWAASYRMKKSNKDAPVRNYNIAERACRHNADLASYWNITEVYSGMASNLQARAREHTFPNPGTAGLALSKYSSLHEYVWLFGYITLNRFATRVSCPEMLLLLGEQMWRAKNGWPLLCAE